MESGSKQPASISAFVVCCNEEKDIGRCLASLTWCDEVIVIDSGSTDKTLEIAKAHSAKIIQRPWPGFVAQKRFGLEQCTTTWILNLDADEEVSPELREEIQGVLRASHSSVHGYELSRVVFYLGRWWRKGGWYPEYRLRLLRRESASWGGQDPHEHAIVDGPTKRLNGELRHYTYESMADQIRTLNNFSSVASEVLAKRGAQTTLLQIVGRAVSRFFKFYILKRGFREGVPGFLVAVAESYYVFLKYAKLWELQQKK